MIAIHGMALFSIKFFNKIKDKTILNLISTKLFDNGVVELNYLVDKK